MSVATATVSGVSKQQHGSNSTYARGCRCEPCKDAHSEAGRGYRGTNADKVQAARRRYYRAHREVAIAKTKAWVEANPDRTRATRKAHREANLERLREYDRARYQQPERRAYSQAAATRSYQANREERIIKAAAYNKVHPEQRRAIHLKRMYGITDAIYEAMYEAQNGRCGICSDPHTRLVVDHDHDSGRVRGLLCRKCNAAIGGLKDSPDLLRRALSWLEDK